MRVPYSCLCLLPIQEKMNRKGAFFPFLLKSELTKVQKLEENGKWDMKQKEAREVSWLGRKLDLHKSIERWFRDKYIILTSLPPPSRQPTWLFLEWLIKKYIFLGADGKTVLRDSPQICISFPKRSMYYCKLNVFSVWTPAENLIVLSSSC